MAHSLLVPSLSESQWVFLPHSGAVYFGLCEFPEISSLKTWDLQSIAALLTRVILVHSAFSLMLLKSQLNYPAILLFFFSCVIFHCLLFLFLLPLFFRNSMLRTLSSRSTTLICEVPIHITQRLESSPWDILWVSLFDK